jgi:phenylpropionate dioxygenase-like ring-hydroxylating dioxygenase large terminal subunit
MSNNHVKDYTSSETFKLECEKLFKPFFHFGAHRSELSESGSFITLDACMKSIVLWNDDGEIRAFENSCSHRGCKLVKDRKGCQSKIVCPYHGWQFRKGQTIPSSKEFLDLGQERLSLTYYQVEFCGEFIFFSPNPSQTLKSQLGSFYDELAEVSLTICKRYDWNEQAFNSNWKIGVENAIESYHVKDVHLSTLFPLDLDTSNVVISGVNDQLIAPINNRKVSNKLSYLNSVFKKVIDKKFYFSYYLFPFSMVSSTYGYSYAVQTFFPSNKVIKTNFVSRVYGVETSIVDFYIDIIEINRKIFIEDSDICELVQEGVGDHKSEFFYGQLEPRIGIFHKNYLEYIK